MNFKNFFKMFENIKISIQEIIDLPKEVKRLEAEVKELQSSINNCCPQLGVTAAANTPETK